MKKKFTAGLVLLALFCFGLIAAKQAEPRKDVQLTRLARHMFVKQADFRKVKSFADFAMLAATKYAKDITAGLAQAGMPELAEPLIAKLKEPLPFMDGEFAQNTVFEWMFFRKNGKAEILVRPVWIGDAKKPSPQNVAAYLFDFCANDKHYFFAAPKVCLNLSLLRVAPLTADCALTVDKTGDCQKPGDSIKVSMSASPDLSEAKITVTPEGAVVQPQGANVWMVSFPTAGEYTVTGEAKRCDGKVMQCGQATVKVAEVSRLSLNVTPACAVVKKVIAIQTSAENGKVTSLVVHNDKGVEVLNQKDPTAPVQFTSRDPGTYKVDVEAVGACEQKLNAQAEFRFVEPVRSPIYLFAEAGLSLAKGCYSGYEYQRVGVGFWLVDRTLAFEVEPGLALSLGSDRFHSFVMVDGRLALHLDRVYAGLGAGYSGKVRDNEENKGVIYGDWKAAFTPSAVLGYYLDAARSWSLMGELRFPVVSGLKFTYNHEFLLGVRYTWQLKSNTDPCAQGAK